MTELQKAILCFDITVQRRVIEMATDMTYEVVEKIVQAKWFVLQLDLSMDISNESQLVVFVQLWDDVEVLERKSLKGNAGGRAIFEVINDFFIEEKFKWQ